jgi:hypothetical protein
MLAREGGDTHLSGDRVAIQNAVRADAPGTCAEWTSVASPHRRDVVVDRLPPPWHGLATTAPHQPLDEVDIYSHPTEKSRHQWADLMDAIMAPREAAG